MFDEPAQPPCVHWSRGEMALPPRDKAVVRKENLGDLLEVGSGGFGRVYKARHQDWGRDVAVKILNRDARSSMFKEADFMDLSAFEFVLRVYGIYEGPSGERGLVTAYMKRGSIESLQEKLSGPPPWPLAFQLAHQTALAMNFLHLKDIVHLDLKPNNILLSDELNARLADFGLSTVSRSVVGGPVSHTGPQGTFKYMPPEAFKLSYEPTRSFDIYSFGILLWSIFSGKEPYQGAGYSRVELRIVEEDDRPGCENLLSLQVDGIKELVELMKTCWVKTPSERPRFRDIFKTTECLFSRHSHNVRRAVDEVLTKLDLPNQAQEKKLNPSNDYSGAPLNDVVDLGDIVEVKLESFQTNRNSRVRHDRTQLSSDGDSRQTMTREEKAEFVDDHRPAIIQGVTHALAIAEELGKMVHSETYSKIRAIKTPEGQVRELYSILRVKKVKAAFYDALKKHEPFLMDELKG